MSRLAIALTAVALLLGMLVGLVTVAWVAARATPLPTTAVADAVAFQPIRAELHTSVATEIDDKIDLPFLDGALNSAVLAALDTDRGETLLIDLADSRAQWELGDTDALVRVDILDFIGDAGPLLSAITAIVPDGARLAVNLEVQAEREPLVWFIDRAAIGALGLTLFFTAFATFTKSTSTISTLLFAAAVTAAVAPLILRRVLGSASLSSFLVDAQLGQSYQRILAVAGLAALLAATERVYRLAR